MVFVTCLEWACNRWFCYRNAGRVYLVCSRRHGWDALLRNNLIPVVPDDVTVIRAESSQGHETVLRLARRNTNQISTPYLALVTRKGVRSRSLNHRLQGIKNRGKRSTDAQQQIAIVLSKALAELRSGAA